MRIFYKISLLFFFSIGLCLTSNSQTSVSIYSARDSTPNGSSCGVPQSVYFLLQGFASGYTQPNDSVTIKVWHGDGNVTTIKSKIWSSWWTGYFQYNYTQTGYFTVKYLVIAPDGKRDSSIVKNEVLIGDTCGNISGSVFNDINNNCLINAGELLPQNSIYVELLRNGKVEKYSTVDNNGKYFFNVPINNTYEIRIANIGYLYNSGYSVACPASSKYIVSLNSSGSHNNDFGLNCPSSFDLSGSFFVHGTRPGRYGGVYIRAWNNSCTAIMGKILIVLDPRAKYSSPGSFSIAPTKISPAPTGDTLEWSNISLNNNLGQNFYNPFYVKFDTTFTFGDTLCWTQIELPNNGDVNPVDNIQTLCAPASASWDPNMKHVSPKGVGSAGYIANNQTMTYTVEFQNTGNDTAFNIYILDTISSNLNLNTLRILGSSHPMKLQLLDNDVLKFRFDNIHLVDSNTNEPLSHGYVQFSIDQQPNLTQGTEIKNKVGIYFDYNEPVITNTVLNTIDISLNVAEKVETFDNEIKLYPNPSNGNFTVETEILTNVMVTDLVGKVIYQSTVNGKELINLANVSNGIYNVVFNNASGFSSTKLVIAK